tara:strand:- start:193 stop:471 length:279 start_codon:yes stop_codon:yes gene_type:complete
MEILESYYIGENETMLFDSNNVNYFVSYNVIRETNYGLGYIDYDTPYDSDETTTEIEMLEYYICDDDLNRKAKVSKRALTKIIDYLTDINNY